MDLSAVIEELERERAEIDAAINALRRLSGHTYDPPAEKPEASPGANGRKAPLPTPAEPLKPRAPRPGGLTTAGMIRKIMLSAPEARWTARELAERAITTGMTDESMGTLKSKFATALATGADFHRVETGIYRLTTSALATAKGA